MSAHTPETAAAILSAFYCIDVTKQAPALNLPTLVMHASGDARVPFEEGRLLASLIPNVLTSDVGNTQPTKGARARLRRISETHGSFQSTSGPVTTQLKN